MKNYFSILLSLLLLSACEEAPLPPEIMEEPDFSIPVFANGLDQKLEAGINGYYLYTQFNQDEEDVYRLEGQLRPSACEGCGPQLRIAFRDIQQRTDGSLPDPNEILQVKSYNFFGSKLDTTAYETRFELELDDASNFTFAWDLGDGSTSTANTFTHMYPSSPATYSVNLQVSGTNCSSELRQDVDVPKATCFPEFSTQLGQNDTEMAFTTMPLSGLTYAWDLGDGTRLNGSSVSHEFRGRGAYKVCLLATGNNCRASHCRNIEVGSADGCAVNFAYSTSPVVDYDQIGLGEIEIYWIDENGISYSSSAQSQPADSYFEVLKVEPYDDNEKGEATLAYSFSLKCKVFADNGELELTIDNGRMAIAHP